jgi:apolipoprotein N-acyltransferase
VLTIAFTAAVFWWFGLGIAAYAAMPAWRGVAALVVLAPVLQPQLVGWSVARALLARRAVRGAALAFASAATYVAIEWLVPKLFADTLGHGFVVSRTLRQAGDLAGAPGLTFAMVLGNECVAAAAREARRGAWPLALRASAACAALALSPTEPSLPRG